MFLITFHHSLRCGVRRAPPARQRGLVLFVALVVLVAMTLAATTLIRSVDTTNLIAGNLSFHESAVYAGERGTEMGVLNWLQANAGKVDVHKNNSDEAYFAVREDPHPQEDKSSWDAFWNRRLASVAKSSKEDAAGNKVSYVIHRLCDGEGAPVQKVGGDGITCFRTRMKESTSSMGVKLQPDSNYPIYYRITIRVEGPRSTVAYLQTIVAPVT